MQYFGLCKYEEIKQETFFTFNYIFTIFLQNIIFNILKLERLHNLMVPKESATALGNKIEADVAAVRFTNLFM